MSPALKRRFKTIGAIAALGIVGGLGFALYVGKKGIRRKGGSVSRPTSTSANRIVTKKHISLIVPVSAVLLLALAIGSFWIHRSKLERSRKEFFQGGNDACFKRVVAKYPDLEPAWKHVPDNRNGFLQFLEFCESRRTGGIGTASLGLSNKSSAMFSETIPWDPEKAAKELDAQRENIVELTRVGLLAEQSVSGLNIDRYSYPEPRCAKKCADILLASSRVAAETGDTPRMHTLSP